MTARSYFSLGDKSFLPLKTLRFRGAAKIMLIIIIIKKINYLIHKKAIGKFVIKDGENNLRTLHE